jgi:MHS family proline/betaine transporter-like MFS transporter
LEETGAFKALNKKEKNTPLRDLFKSHRKILIASFFYIASGTMATYTLSVYIPLYAKTQLGLSLKEAYIALAFGSVIAIISGLFFAWLSDYIGRKLLLQLSTLLFFLVLYPLFIWLIDNPSFSKLMWMKFILGIIGGMGGGPYTAAMAEQFPTHVRSTGLGIAYNFAVALFGGSSPFIVEWLVQQTGSKMMPAYYLMAGCLLGFISLFFFVDRHKEKSLG